MNLLMILRKHLVPVACLVLVAMLPSCASPQDQFGHAVMTGNTNSAKQFVAPRYARMTITESNGQQSVPIQYAIVQQNKEMASFLLANDCHKKIGGNNLTYYSASNGYPEMAKFFASRGEGSYGDIERARQKRDQGSQMSNSGGLIALGLLAVLAGGGGSDSGSGRYGEVCRACGGGGTSHEWGMLGRCTECNGKGRY